MTDDNCPKCGGTVRFLAGTPAHRHNLYCENESGCGWRAWENRAPVRPSSRSPGCYPVRCPHCGWDLQGIKTLWYEAGCPPSGICFNCKTCSKPVEISPDTTFKAKAG